MGLWIGDTVYIVGTLEEKEEQLGRNGDKLEKPGTNSLDKQETTMKEGTLEEGEATMEEITLGETTNRGAEDYTTGEGGAA